MRNPLAYLRRHRYFYICDERPNRVTSGIGQTTEKAITLAPNGRLFMPHPRACPETKSMWLEISTADLRYWRGQYYRRGNHYYAKIWWNK